MNSTHKLQPHPSTPSQAIEGIDVTITFSRAFTKLVYRLSGNLKRLRLPGNALAKRSDNLWQHTCFELFMLEADGRAYQEYNFSPSGAWAHYRFSAYRKRLPDDKTIMPPGISTRPGTGIFELEAEIPPVTGRLGLSAVIEDNDGNLSYWALDHPAPEPDFHHPDAFTLTLK